MSLRSISILISALLLLVPGIAAAQQQAAKPRLVIFLSVDQLRGDYLDRFAPQLTGGFARMMREGAFFDRAFHDHGLTVTAVGHASMLSGRFPRSTGILSNSLGVPDPQAVSIEGTPSASPWRFRGSVLIDWMRVVDPLSRALSASVKDRGAILPLGRAKQQAYWYTSTGAFTTSNYYTDTLPDWVKRFNALKLPERYAGREWKPLLDPSLYPEPDTILYEAAGGSSAFPHRLPRDVVAATRLLATFPWIDQVNLEFALAGLDALQLGKTGHTDLLSISLSATDAIGHSFGPESREVHDQILRLDRALGDFIDSIYARFRPEEVIFAMTADHGVTSFPELVAEPGREAAYRVNLNPIVAELRGQLATRGIGADGIRMEGGMVFFSRALAARSALADTVTQLFISAARAVPGVERVDRVRDLVSMDTINDAITRRWLHMVPPDMPIPLVVTLKDAHVFGTTRSATHGSPRDRDAHVPIIFMGSAFKPGRYSQFVRTVDIAPTLGFVLGVPPTEPIDGKVLRAALKESW